MTCKDIQNSVLTQNLITKEWYIALVCSLSPCDAHPQGGEAGRRSLDEVEFSSLVRLMVGAFYRWQDNKYYFTTPSGKVETPRKITRAYAFVKKYIDCGDGRWDTPTLLPKYDEKTVRPLLIRELCAIHHLADRFDKIADRRFDCEKPAPGNGARFKRINTARELGKPKRRICPDFQEQGWEESQCL